MINVIQRSSCEFSDKQMSTVTVLACVTRKVLGKEVLGHLGGVGQYYRWW